ncbi:MAG: branched-chain amino acid aminotransferase [Rhodospirillales bacterium]|jgi:branched-chain amino acid aminotransferase|nr:branched-chain amino acid aminotransferase [Rhodospirillales bacterium]MDP6882555.1 branched-chain amino acid aminotransferase [Rhodospirillales bacterium]
MAKDTDWAGRTLTYVDGAWQDGNPRVLGPRSHAVWLGSAVFDGARAIKGRAPDLDRHCARVVKSASLMGLEPMLSGAEIEDLARDGIGRFGGDQDLYICPMFYPEDGFIVPDPASTRFILTIHESPLPEGSGISACLSSFRRPARDMAPTEAKAACLYPNVARCLREAQAKGFETAVVLDPAGNVAEFAYANLFAVKDGVVATPVHNGTFLNGITRQRVIALLRGDGVEVMERSIDFAEVLAADELFGTGNYAKVVPCTRIEDRDLQAGPMTRRARELYFRFAGEAAV